MACLLVAAVTGIWLVFRVEMDRLVNPHLRVVQPGGGRVSLSSIAAAAERRFPASQVQALILQERPDDSVGVYLRARDGAEPVFDQAFFNPYGGAFLGARSTSRLVFDREHVDPMIDRLHYSLWMNSWGLWLMGIVAWVWLVTSIVGLALAWPRLWARIASWLPVLSARVDRGPYQTNYRLHRAAGVWFLPVLVLLAFTSLYQNLPQSVRPIVNWMSPLAERPRGRPLADGTPVVPPDLAVVRLKQRFPDARPSSIGFDLRSSRYSILFHLPGDLSPNGENWAFVDAGSGQVIGLKVTATSRAGDRFLTWIFPLHTGTAFGTPGRIVIALAGVVLVGLMISGFYVWNTKWRMRRRARVMRRLTTMTLFWMSALLVVDAQTPYPRTLSDAKGHTVTLAAKPARIASVVLGVDENLADLVDPARIVAMTELSKMPEVSNIADRVPAGKAYIKGEWQKVIDAKPDLVLTAVYTPTLSDPLVARKLPVYQFSEFNSVDALLKNFEILGQLVGEEQKAAAVLKADRARLVAAAQKKWPKPIKAVYFSEGFLFAGNTVPSQVLTLAGFTDAASEFGLAGAVKASPALIGNLHPDVVLFGEDSKAAEDETAAMFKKPEYQAIAAVKAGRLYAIPGKHITTTSHLIVNAVSDAQRLVEGGMR